MIPKWFPERLSTNMQSTETAWQMWAPPQSLAAPKTQPKESQLKLSLETRYSAGVVIIHCQGRIVYRDEAIALTRMVEDLVDFGGKVVLDLSDVSTIDSAGIGELVLLHTWAQDKNVELKYAGPRPFVRDVFDLTGVGSFLDVHPSLGEALASFEQPEVCADC
jgi:anti-sigma B factor antagonist